MKSLIEIDHLILKVVENLTSLEHLNDLAPVIVMKEQIAESRVDHIMIAA